MLFSFDLIFKPLKAKTGCNFSVMLLTENELIGRLAEADLQAIKGPYFFSFFMMAILIFLF